MNRLMTEHSPLLESTQERRHELLSILTDDDLGYALPGNLTLGALCREMGEMQHSYVESFKTFKQDYFYRHPDPAVETSVAALSAWFDALDAELKAALNALSDDDLDKTIDRGFGYAPTAQMNFHVYREALLIFYAKAHLYVKALGKRVPGNWPYWIGDRPDWEIPAD